MTFKPSPMDILVLKFIASNGGRATVSAVQHYFTARRSEARASLLRLKAARALNVSRGAFDFYEITEYGRTLLS